MKITAAAFIIVNKMVTPYLHQNTVVMNEKTMCYYLHNGYQSLTKENEVLTHG